ncbi:RICIN domain-containing protein [Streptomyces sp. NBC_00285]|uniref:RICIN domain-containing protein n=1 Tax=Streptomyces sp. NBC_00285 TaxID=2975700 RepID=UPI002E2C4342|nr:RICIN domain-containing protein [Streptomyces sp. NBC_00285]
MPSSYPPRPPHPPRPGLTPGESDRDLFTQLSGQDTERQHATALLLARHWSSARDYALLCLASATPAAPLAATSAFHQVLNRFEDGIPDGALRPQLLVAVRETVRAWAADEGACAAMPELRKPTGGRGLYTAKPGVATSRKLAERAFVALPAISQCLLWHTEVEAEPIDIPAGLSGFDTAVATSALGQAREQFRAGVVRAHRELAPSSECRFHNRLIDVAARKDGSLPPDVRLHLGQCPHCRHALEQLGYFEGGLGVLLADAVLGWGGRRYLASRPGRSDPADWSATEATAGSTPGGRHRTGADSRHRTAAAVGAGLTSLALLVVVLAARGWSDDGQGMPGVPAWGVPTAVSTSPDPSALPVGAAPSTASLSGPGTDTDGSLRNAATGLCLDVAGPVDSGAEADLARCSSAVSQQWSYQFDGTLRSGADPSLCLATDPGGQSVRLASCTDQPGQVSYVLTAGGELLLGRHQDLALAAEPGTETRHVVAAHRDGSGEQLWAFQKARPKEGSNSPT